MRNAHTLRYQSFLIRLWQDSEGGAWRGSLENPHTGELRAFARLEDLLNFVQAQTQPDNLTNPSPHSNLQGD